LAEKNSSKIKYSQDRENFFRRIFIHPWLYHMVRMALAAVFIYGGVIKLFHLKTFAMTIAYYNIVPEMFSSRRSDRSADYRNVAGGALLSTVYGDCV